MRLHVWDVLLLAFVSVIFLRALRRVKKGKACGCCEGCAGSCGKKNDTNPR